MDRCQEATPNIAMTKGECMRRLSFQTFAVLTCFLLFYGLSFAAQTGSLRATIAPQGAIDAGAQWRRVGTSTWQNIGSTETAVPVGQYTLEFIDVSGWAKPGNQVVTISQGRTTLAMGTYTTQTGFLMVMISPQVAINAGAQWRVDGGAWHDSEYTQTGLSVDQHLVEFSNVAGWTKPVHQTVMVSEGQTTLAIGGYTATVPRASLQR